MMTNKMKDYIVISNRTKRILQELLHEGSMIDVSEGREEQEKKHMTEEEYEEDLIKKQAAISPYKYMKEMEELRLGVICSFFSDFISDKKESNDELQTLVLNAYKDLQDHGVEFEIDDTIEETYEGPYVWVNEGDKLLLKKGVVYE